MSVLTIDTATLREVANPSTDPTEVGRGSPSRGGVSEEVLEETLRWNEQCRCRELGLHAGLPIRELALLGSGCTGETIDGQRLKPSGQPGWVCPRLDAVRRRYGK